MIKISAARNKQREITEKLLCAKLRRVREELSSVNFCLSDENCQFQINPNICSKANFLAVQIKARPIVGLYCDIDFVVSVFIEDCDNLKPPKIYNDRRVFHPNIDPFTCEIAVPEIIYWNPTYTLTYLFRRIKYTLIEPNSLSIPNNHICRKAAFFYKLDRENYRTYVIQYCPTVLDQIAHKEITHPQVMDSLMEDESIIEGKKYVQISEILPVSRLEKTGKNTGKAPVQQRDEQDRQQQQFQFLNKRLSQMRIYSEDDEEKRQQTCFQFDSQIQMMSYE